jgi:uncharacterized protein YqeY
MSLLQRIKQDLLQARKDVRASNADATISIRAQVKVKCLTTLLSEASRPGLDDGKRESTDQEVIAVAQKFIKNINETLSHCSDDDLFMELEFINAYIPKQLTEGEIAGIIAGSGIANVGDAMKYLKSNFSGQYDGKIASQVVKELFS